MTSSDVFGTFLVEGRPKRRKIIKLMFQADTAEMSSPAVVYISGV